MLLNDFKLAIFRNCMLFVKTIVTINYAKNNNFYEI